MPRLICEDRAGSAVIRAIARNRHRRPDALAIDGERLMRWHELADAIEQCAAELEHTDNGVVAWQLDEDWRWIVLDLACLASGRTALPLPLFFSDEQVRHALAAAGCGRLVVSGQRRLDEYPETPPYHLPSIDADLIDTGSGQAGTLLPADTAKITFTSGSTGTPKGVCLSRSLLERVAASLNERLGDLTMGDHLRTLPLAVLLENVAGLYRSLLADTRYILPAPDEAAVLGSSSFCTERLAASIERYAPKVIITMPQMLQRMTTSPRREAFARLDYVAVGGAPVPVRVLQAARANGIAAYEGYGLSECGSVVSLNVPGDDRPGSVGRPLPHAALSSMAGEVVVSGACFNGYLGDPSRAAASVETGDIGHCDGDGRLWIEGRRDNRILTPMGRNVSPEWIESMIAAALPDVPVCVLGNGDGLTAIVATPREDLSGVDTELHRINAQLPDYARIRTRIAVTESFSVANGCLTANGRLRRDAIRSRFASHVSAGDRTSLVESDVPKAAIQPSDRPFTVERRS